MLALTLSREVDPMRPMMT